MGETKAIQGPTLRRAALMTLLGYVLSWGVPFASFSILPRLYDAHSALQTTQNLTAHPSLFVVVIYAFLLNFIGDVVSAWGLYLLLRPTNAFISMFVAWLRVVFAGIGFSATLNLVTAHHLVTKVELLTALGKEHLEAQVQVAIDAFNAQFAFSLILFGVYLLLLGWLVYRSGHMPRWLGVLLALNGAAWCVMQSGPYLAPGVNLGFLFIFTFGELVLLVWLAVWGLRLREPAASANS